jgi:hypothetical protein
MPPVRSYFRAHPRKALRASATVTDVSEARTVQAKVRNLGLGGVCLETEDPLPTDRDLVVAFVTPSMWDPLQLHARVAWARPGAFPAVTGLKFRYDSAVALAALFDFLEQSRFTG